jgi:hypothetical protein
MNAILAAFSLISIVLFVAVCAPFLFSKCDVIITIVKVENPISRIRIGNNYQPKNIYQPVLAMFACLLPLLPSLF